MNIVTNRHLISTAITVALTLCFLNAVNAQQQRSYLIGNSLINDMSRGGGLEEIASSISTDVLLASQHIQCSTPLSLIISTAINEPDTNHTCSGSRSTAGANYDLGTYPVALNNQIDTLVLQPFQEATLQEEIDATKAIIDQLRENPLNANTQVYIYQTWDLRRNSEDYLADWYGRHDLIDEEFRPCQNTYDVYFNALTEAGYEFEIIPVGQAFADASELLQAGQLGNLTDTTSLFRDFIHGSNAGRYLAALVAAKVLTNESVLAVADGSEFAAFLNTAHDTIPDADASAALRAIAEDVVNAPVIRGDVNFDNSVDFLDISPFIEALATGTYQHEADVDRSGFVNFLDIAPFIRILSGG